MGSMPSEPEILTASQVALTIGTFQAARDSVAEPRASSRGESVLAMLYFLYTGLLCTSHAFWRLQQEVDGLERFLSDQDHRPSV